MQFDKKIDMRVTAIKRYEIADRDGVNRGRLAQDTQQRIIKKENWGFFKSFFEGQGYTVCEGWV